MAGFVQIWSSQQLEKGASGCPDYHGTTGPNTHAIVLSNDSENTLLYRSDVDSGLYVPPRTSLTIPCDSNMQYVLTVDASSVPTTTSNQLVILSETNQELAYSSTPLPAPSLVQFIATIFPGNIDLVIPPQFTAIVVVPVDQQTQLTITGIDSTFAYFEAPFTQPITIQMYPGLDPSGLQFQGTGGGTTKVYGLTVPLTELGTASPVLATIVAPVASALQASSVLTGLPIPDTLSLLAGWDESDPTNILQLRVLRAAADNADAVAAQADSTLKAIARLTAFNGVSYDRLRSLGDNADAVSINTLGALLALARNTLFNGTTWDRQPGSTQGAIVDPIPAQQLVATSAANAPVTLTIPAPGSNQRIQIDWLRVNIWNPSGTALNETPDGIAFTGLDMASGPVYSRVLPISSVTTVIDQSFPHGLRASFSNTAVTITVNAIGAGCLSRIMVGYHIDQAGVT